MAHRENARSKYYHDKLEKLKVNLSTDFNELTPRPNWKDFNKTFKFEAIDGELVLH